MTALSRELLDCDIPCHQLNNACKTDGCENAEMCSPEYAWRSFKFAQSDHRTVARLRLRSILAANLAAPESATTWYEITVRDKCAARTTHWLFFDLTEI